MQPFETIYIDSMVAACNGGGGPLGHPKVYLNLSADGKVECPYCSRLFVHRSLRAGDKAMQHAEGHVSDTGSNHGHGHATSGHAPSSGAAAKS
jgi:uncharacterized Zn-finger protein